jgi:hypothetical protein
MTKYWIWESKTNDERRWLSENCGIFKKDNIGLKNTFFKLQNNYITYSIVNCSKEEVEEKLGFKLDDLKIPKNPTWTSSN